LVYVSEIRTPHPAEGGPSNTQATRAPYQESLLTPPRNPPSDQESRPSPPVSPVVVTPEPKPEPPPPPESGIALRTAPKTEVLAQDPEPAPLPPVNSVYVLRTAPKKEELINQLGGSPESERAVQAGLDWLIRHQADDGSWSDACLGPKSEQPGSRCEPMS